MWALLCIFTRGRDIDVEKRRPHDDLDGAKPFVSLHVKTLRSYARLPLRCASVAKRKHRRANSGGYNKHPARPLKRPEPGAGSRVGRAAPPLSFPAPGETRLSTRSQSPSRFLADRRTILAETNDEITASGETWNANSAFTQRTVAAFAVRPSHRLQVVGKTANELRNCVRRGPWAQTTPMGFEPAESRATPSVQ